MQIARFLLFLAGAASASTPLSSIDRIVDNVTPLTNAPFERTFSDPSATFVSLHFKYIQVPRDGFITVSAADGSQAVNYTGHRRDFFAEFIPGTDAKVTYTPPAHAKSIRSARPVFVLDRFAAGTGEAAAPEAICGKDDSKPNVCLKDADATKYTKAQAVARLRISGKLCTGWLFGSEGHLVTNNHCIGDAASASKVDFEFGAECASCTDSQNSQQLACKGEVVANSATLIATDKKLDFSLVKLNLKPGVSLVKYGYLQARASGPVVKDPIYIPQHPGGKPKRIATVLDDGTIGVIDNVKGNYASYQLDTEGGSSGSPVLSAMDNAVLVLHNSNAAQCVNGGIRIDQIVTFLQKLSVLPLDSVINGTSPQPSTSSLPPSTSTKAPTTRPQTTTQAPATSKTPATTSPATTAPYVTKSPPKRTTPAPTTTRPRKTCKPKTKKPSTTTPPTESCGTCKGCYFPEAKWCLQANLSKEACLAAQGSVWCRS